MSSDGKQLEELVAFVEENLLPPGFEVKSNARVCNDEGVIAEFDVEIRGKIGTTTFSWLIECRDRPGAGSAPASWIEQLVGRKTRFGFNKVTAVSTTGFAQGAVQFANAQGIELREVRSLDPQEFAAWIRIAAFHVVRRIADLKHAQINVSPNGDAKLMASVAAVLESSNCLSPIFASSVTGAKVTPSDAFLGAVTASSAFEAASPERPQNLHLTANYTDDDHYLLETAEGSVSIKQIEFFGQLRIEETSVPVAKTVEYRHSDSGEVISQLAAFAAQPMLGMNLSLEFHHMKQSGETHFIMRKLSPEREGAEEASQQ